MQAISSIEPAVLPSSHHKIEASILAFDENIDKDLILKGVQSAESSSKLTPARFVHSMRVKCARQPQTIVLPESNDHRILSAAAAAHSKGLAKIVLLGEESLIQQVRTSCCCTVHLCIQLNPVACDKSMFACRRRQR